MRMIREHRNEFPERLLPELECEGLFGNLVASFFRTSFHAEYLVSNDRIDFARLRVGGSPFRQSRAREQNTVSYAIRHWLAFEGIRIDAINASKLARRRDIRDETRVVAYVWELNRRAHGKSRGSVVHGVWKSMPQELRTELTEEIVWLAFEVVRRQVTDAEVRP